MRDQGNGYKSMMAALKFVFGDTNGSCFRSDHGVPAANPTPTRSHLQVFLEDDPFDGQRGTEA
jgi:hypothetical protein